MLRVAAATPGGGRAEIQKHELPARLTFPNQENGVELVNTGLVSAVIPSFNNNRTIEICLESVRNQTYRKIEIIIVDNHSSDGTVNIAKRFGARIISRNIGMSAARNIGVESSSGEFVFNIDSDYELDPRAIEDCVGLCRNGIDCVSMHELFVASSYWSKCRMMEQMTYWGDVVVEVPRFIRRKVFEAVGGYDERLTAGEDYDLGHRLRQYTSNIAASRYFVKHHELGTLRYIVFKKYRYGKSISLYLRKYGLRSFRDFSLIRPAWLRHREILMSQPQYAVGILFIKFLQYVVSFLGLLQGMGKQV